MEKEQLPVARCGFNPKASGGGLDGLADAQLHELMWLTVLRVVLYGMFILFMAAIAFVGGAWTAKKMAREPVPLAVDEVSPERQREARDLLEAALTERFFGRHERALENLDNARRRNPVMRGLDYQIGLTHLDLKNHDEALDAARLSADKNEETSNAHALVALVLLESVPPGGSLDGVSGEILAEIRLSREADPLNPMPLYVLAEFHRAAGQPERAVEAYQRAIERVSKTDSIMVSTVKAGLSGIRLNHSPTAPPLGLVEVEGVHPPEQLFFGAADALLRGDRPQAEEYLREAQRRLPEPLFDALLQDSFFQDFLPGGMVDAPSPDPPQP